MNDNAYKVNLVEHYRVLATFNVADMSPFFDDHLANLRENSLQQREDDGVPPMESFLAHPNIQGSLDSTAKVQGIVQV